MSKKHLKQRSFLEEPALEILDTAAKKACEDILRLPSLLQGQEDNLFLNQATEIAEIEAKMFTDAIAHLKNIFTDKLNLLEAKVQLIDQIEKIPASAISNDPCEQITSEMKELKNKLRKGDHSFLSSKTQGAIRPEEPKRPTATRSVSFQLYHEQSTTCIASNSIVQENSANSSGINLGFLGKPQFSSDLGRKMVADVEAQESARRTRSAFTPSNMHGSEFKKPLHSLPPVAEKENQITKGVFQSGGSSLDGSFLMNGVTFEEIMRPRSVTPGSKIPSKPNFDETGLDDFEDKADVPPVPPTNEAPPMSLPKTNYNLGPIQPEIHIVHKITDERPTRPQFTSAIGQKLSNK